jgi:hypothetical protein
MKCHVKWAKNCINLAEAGRMLIFGISFHKIYTELHKEISIKRFKAKHPTLSTSRMRLFKKNTRKSLTSPPPPSKNQNLIHNLS